MKIPKSLEKFMDKSALIIVSAGKKADLYFLSGGEINLITEIKAPELKFSDKEGFFGGVGGSGGGAVKDSLDNKEEKEFFRELKKYLDDNWRPEFEEVIILTTEQDKETAINALPQMAKNVVISKQFGNYTKKTPIEILETISL